MGGTCSFGTARSRLNSNTNQPLEEHTTTSGAIAGVSSTQGSRSSTWKCFRKPPAHHKSNKFMREQSQQQQMTTKPTIDAQDHQRVFEIGRYFLNGDSEETNNLPRLRQEQLKKWQKFLREGHAALMKRPKKQTKEKQKEEKSDQQLQQQEQQQKIESVLASGSVDKYLLANLEAGKEAKLKKFIEKGAIPQDDRWSAWKALVNVSAIYQKGLFELLVQAPCACVKDICKDIGRAFPDEPFFRTNELSKVIQSSNHLNTDMPPQRVERSSEQQQLTRKEQVGVPNAGVASVVAVAAATAGAEDAMSQALTSKNLQRMKSKSQQLRNNSGLNHGQESSYSESITEGKHAHFSNAEAAEKDNSQEESRSVKEEQEEVMRSFAHCSSAGQTSLLRVLRALSHFFPQFRYTQGMNLVVGFFLLVSGGAEEEAFWMFVRLAISERFLIVGLYENEFPMIDIAMYLLDVKLREILPEVHAHIRKHLQVNYVEWFFQWALTLFLDKFALRHAVRFWDFIISQNSFFAFISLALAILKETCAPEQQSGVTQAAATATTSQKLRFLSVDYGEFHYIFNSFKESQTFDVEKVIETAKKYELSLEFISQHTAEYLKSNETFISKTNRDNIFSAYFTQLSSIVTYDQSSESVEQKNQQQSNQQEKAKQQLDAAISLRIISITEIERLLQQFEEQLAFKKSKFTNHKFFIQEQQKQQQQGRQHDTDHLSEREVVRDPTIDVIPYALDNPLPKRRFLRQQYSNNLKSMTLMNPQYQTSSRRSSIELREEEAEKAIMRSQLFAGVAGAPTKKAQEGGTNLTPTGNIDRMNLMTSSRKLPPISRHSQKIHHPDDSNRPAENKLRAIPKNSFSQVVPPHASIPYDTQNTNQFQQLHQPILRLNSTFSYPHKSNTLQFEQDQPEQLQRFVQVTNLDQLEPTKNPFSGAAMQELFQATVSGQRSSNSATATEKLENGAAEVTEMNPKITKDNKYFFQSPLKNNTSKRILRSNSLIKPQGFQPRNSYQVNQQLNFTNIDPSSWSTTIPNLNQQELKLQHKTPSVALAQLNGQRNMVNSKEMKQQISQTARKSSLQPELEDDFNFEKQQNYQNNIQQTTGTPKELAAPDSSQKMNHGTRRNTNSSILNIHGYATSSQQYYFHQNHQNLQQQLLFDHSNLNVLRDHNQASQATAESLLLQNSGNNIPEQVEGGQKMYPNDSKPRIRNKLKFKQNSVAIITPNRVKQTRLSSRNQEQENEDTNSMQTDNDIQNQENSRDYAQENLSSSRKEPSSTLHENECQEQFQQQQNGNQSSKSSILKHSNNMDDLNQEYLQSFQISEAQQSNVPPENEQYSLHNVPRDISERNTAIAIAVVGNPYPSSADMVIVGQPEESLVDLIGDTNIDQHENNTGNYESNPLQVIDRSSKSIQIAQTFISNQTESKQLRGVVAELISSGEGHGFERGIIQTQSEQKKQKSEQFLTLPSSIRRIPVHEIIPKTDRLDNKGFVVKPTGSPFLTTAPAAAAAAVAATVTITNVIPSPADPFSRITTKNFPDQFDRISCQSLSHIPEDTEIGSHPSPLKRKEISYQQHKHHGQHEELAIFQALQQQQQQQQQKQLLQSIQTQKFAQSDIHQFQEQLTHQMMLSQSQSYSKIPLHQPAIFLSNYDSNPKSYQNSSSKTGIDSKTSQRIIQPSSLLATTAAAAVSGERVNNFITNRAQSSTQILYDHPSLINTSNALLNNQQFGVSQTYINIPTIISTEQRSNQQNPRYIQNEQLSSGKKLSHNNKQVQQLPQQEQTSMSPKRKSPESDKLNISAQSVYSITSDKRNKQNLQRYHQYSNNNHLNYGSHRIISSSALNNLVSSKTNLPVTQRSGNSPTGSEIKNATNSHTNIN